MQLSYKPPLSWLRRLQVQHPQAAFPASERRQHHHNWPPPPPIRNSPSEPDAGHPLPAFLKTQASYISLSKSLGRSLFMVGFAITLSSVIEFITSSVGLTPYHTFIVLNMSLINNWGGFCLLVPRRIPNIMKKRVERAASLKHAATCSPQSQPLTRLSV